jgi:cytochrome c-type biogenesis protein CcmH/NrfG
MPLQESVSHPSEAPKAWFARDRDLAHSVVRRLCRRLQTRDDAEAWHAMGVALVALDDRAAAIAAFRNALRLDADRFSSRLALGNLLFDAGQCERALSCFAMLERAPRHGA